MSKPLDNLVQRIKSGKTRRESQPSKAALLGSFAVRPLKLDTYRGHYIRIDGDDSFIEANVYKKNGVLVTHLGSGFPGYSAKARHETYRAFFERGRRIIDASQGD